MKKIVKKKIKEFLLARKYKLNSIMFENYFKRIINITSKGIGDKTIAKVVEYMETFDISLFDAIDKIYSEN